MTRKESHRTDADILFEYVYNRWGGQLSPDELEDIRNGIEAITQTVQALRTVQLQNQDEPFTRFTPYKKGGNNHG